jgi:DHA1 family inner membrane transport protein
MPVALLALTAGAFGIGVTEFVLMGLLLEVSADLHVTVAQAGLLISGYAFGVVLGAPVLTALTARWPRKAVLVGLMVIFTVGNAACALAPGYALLMAARVLTAFAHGTFFGVGSVVATGLVQPNRRASAIAIMFTGLTVASILGVPLGTWLGQAYGWRATFWAIVVIGVIALSVIVRFVPREAAPADAGDWRQDMRVLMRGPVLLGLLTTVLGYAGVLAVFTYIAPLITEVTGYTSAAVSPVMLVFGGGLIVGNLVGGRLADRHLRGTLIGTLVALAVTLALMTLAVHDKVWAVVFVALLGAVAFSTVPPLQMWVLEKAHGAGQSIASSFNIAAFNLGNALGAWAGGVIISHGPGLTALPWVAALAPVSALALILIGLRLHGSGETTAQCPQGA